MKKNIMMRLASFLLVAVLISTSAISGTYAKYVTKNSGKDNAQVAKFGVVINVADDLGMFNTEYDVEDDTYKGTGTVSVKSESNVNMVAPGTKGNMTFNITGKPEVATRVAIKFGDTTNAVQLAAGTYTLPAGAFEAAEKTVTTTEVYEPIKFYFGTDAITDATVYNLTLSDLKDAMKTAFTVDYAPLHDFTAEGHTYYLGWSWAFEDDTNENTDFLDTYLGWQAAKDQAQKEILDFEISVTQID